MPYVAPLPADLIALYQDHKVGTDDASVIKDADLTDFDPEAIRAYREMRATANPVDEYPAWSGAASKASKYLDAAWQGR